MSEQNPMASEGPIQRAAVRPLEDGVRVFVEQIRVRGSRYARRRFGDSLRHWAAQDLSDLIEDAIQHLAIVSAAHAGDVGRPAFDAWCKRVVSNFIVSELRYRSRRSLLPPAGSDLSGPAEATVEAREGFDRLVGALRGEVTRASKSRDRSRRLALLNEFLRGMFEERQASDARAANRVDQRRSRGRRLAREAWQRVRATQPSAAEFDDIARALGLSRSA